MTLSAKTSLFAILTIDNVAAAKVQGSHRTGKPAFCRRHPAACRTAGAKPKGLQRFRIGLAGHPRREEIENAEIVADPAAQLFPILQPLQGPTARMQSRQERRNRQP